MAITMIDTYQVLRSPFEESHLLSKQRKAVCVARTVGTTVHEPTYIHSVNVMDLDGDLFNSVKADYEEVQACLKDPSRGFTAPTGSMGVYVQSRTKGVGHGSTSRAFYARPNFLAKFISLE